ncbi:helix-turn-helix transcriptional regulator [Candidatus Finniella inopinata]|uniref:DNA-binding protein n=1 Tax=Candidatus Finniella inopinata TaxID=1696036 RepID=A0A4V2DZY3_9PROT|nr:helix-turn-helix domain-containing protein [Candidatus Finniella inopinata]RZI46657.1 DNA-binding protein [Candidatus Finniella inopinata]
MMAKKFINADGLTSKTRVAPELEAGDEEFYYTTQELSGLLGVAPSTLSAYRCAGVGPKFIVFGHRTLRYARSDIQAYMKDRARQSTSEEGPLMPAFNNRR